MARAKKPDQEEKDVTATQLAEHVGEPYDSVDHWAGLGLLVFRRRGRTRHFPLNENLDRCKRIRDLQNEGHSLTTIKGMFNGRA